MSVRTHRFFLRCLAMLWHVRQYRKDGATSMLRVQVRSSCSRSFLPCGGKNGQDLPSYLRNIWWWMPNHPHTFRESRLVFPPARQKNQRLHKLLTGTHNVLVAPSLQYCHAGQSIAKHWRKNQCVPTLKY